MGKKGAKRHEPCSVSMLEGFLEFNTCKSKFVGIKWYDFFQKIRGYDDEVAQKFSQGFDGKVMHIGDFIMVVFEKTVSRATSLHYHGERWFKNKPIERVVCTRFLKEDHQSTN